jgi:drug/metabolite transporter (DMT)-like permease
MSTLWQSLIATVLLLPFFVLPSLQQLFILMVYGIIVSGIGVACYYEGIKYVKVQVAGILILLDPVFAIIWSIFLFNEPLTLMEIIGGILILAAIVIQVIFARNKNDSEKT